MFSTTTVGDMLEGFIDNMPDEQIDSELEFFQNVSEKLNGKGSDYSNLGVVIDEYHMADEDLVNGLKNLVGYCPYTEVNENSGFMFHYFKNETDAEKASSYLSKCAE